MLFNRTFRPDRRRWRRHWFNTSVQLFNESAQLDGRGVTLSAGGMCVFTISNLPLGSEVEVEFLSPRSKEPVRLLGTVRSRALYLYGIEFLSDSNRDHDVPAQLGV